MDTSAQLRIEEVHAAQRAMGMEPRRDSRLTQQFALGTAPREYPTAITVAQELVIVDHIFRTTLYGEIIEQTMRDVAKVLKQRYRRVPWKIIWEVVRFYVPDMLKLHCLITSGVDHMWVGAQPSTLRTGQLAYVNTGGVDASVL